CFKKSEQAAIRTVSQPVAARLNGVTRLHVIGGDSGSLQSSTAGGFQRPHLRLAFFVFNLHINPRMRDNQMHFLDDSLDVHESVHVGAMRMMCPQRHSGTHSTNCHDTKHQLKSHDYLLWPALASGASIRP